MKLYVTVEAGEHAKTIKWLIVTSDRPSREELNLEGKRFSSIIRALVDEIRVSKPPSVSPGSQEKQHTSHPG